MYNPLAIGVCFLSLGSSSRIFSSVGNSDIILTAEPKLKSTSAQSGYTSLIKGMTITAWSYDAYKSSDFDKSIANLVSIKSNWVMFTVFWFMNTSDATLISPRPDMYTASDPSLISAVQKAHSLGLSVGLKPMVDVADADRTWRGLIQPSNWTKWFESYGSFVNHYANLSEVYGIELFVVGTELRSSQSYESNWRETINNVRAIFSRNITYAANWDSVSIYSRLPQYAVRFWDALDFVGVDAYFSLDKSVQS
jgi:hypothetical protein